MQTKLDTCGAFGTQLGESRTLVVPRSFDFIEEEMFEGADIWRAVIPNTTRIIGKGAFRACRDLREVVFEDGSALEEIQPQAFMGCGLATFNTPVSLKRIGQQAFADCMNLGCVNLNEGL